jgi:hypothetical protein
MTKTMHELFDGSDAQSLAPAQIEPCPDLPAPSPKCWSEDGEVFDCDSLCELLSKFDLYPGETVYVGDAVTPDPAKWLVMDDILEQMGERARDDCGESADDYPAVDDAAKQELSDFLQAWARKHCTPSFFAVENVSEYEITEQELE